MKLLKRLLIAFLCLTSVISSDEKNEFSPDFQRGNEHSENLARESFDDSYEKEFLLEKSDLRQNFKMLSDKQNSELNDEKARKMTSGQDFQGRQYQVHYNDFISSEHLLNEDDEFDQNAVAEGFKSFIKPLVYRKLSPEINDNSIKRKNSPIYKNFLKPLIRKQSFKSFAD